MNACRYMDLYVYQEDEKVTVRLVLNNIHADGSEERVVHRLRLDPVTDATDMEDFARQFMAAAIEQV